MKGPRELKRYVAKFKEHIKACHGDDLFLFKMERCKKWRKQNRKRLVGASPIAPVSGAAVFFSGLPFYLTRHAY